MMRRRLRVTIDGHAYDVTVEDLTDTENQLYPEPGSMSVPAATTTVGPAPPSPPPHPSAGPGPARAGVDGGGAAVTAPMSGVVVELPIAVGDAVEVGQVVAVIEAMKLKSPLAATSAGTVTSVDVSVGQPVEAGATLLRLG